MITRNDNLRRLLVATAAIFLLTLSNCAHKESVPVPVVSEPLTGYLPEDFRSEELKLFNRHEVKPPLPFSRVELTHVFFGYLEPSEKGTYFMVSTKVPQQPGRLYGWAARVLPQESNRDVTQPIEVVETFTLPEAPRRLRVDTETTRISEDGKSVTTRLKMKPDHTWIFNFWEISEEDPSGFHTIELQSAEGESLKKFRFELVPLLVK